MMKTFFQLFVPLFIVRSMELSVNKLITGMTAYFMNLSFIPYYILNTLVAAAVFLPVFTGK